MINNIRIGAAAAVLAAAAAGALAASAATTSPSGVACHIEVTRNGNILSLEGIASADRSIAGNYTLNVERSGSGGVSNISQGGAFSATPRRPEALGSAAINLYPAGQFSARMTLSWSDGETSCRTS